MRTFKQNSNNFYVCEECNAEFSLKHHLAKHINKYHHGVKEYYNKYLKEEGEGICKICKKPTEFLNLSRKYKNCCSKTCSKK